MKDRVSRLDRSRSPVFLANHLEGACSSFFVTAAWERALMVNG